MECNKEEALRAKGIAEKKMESKDFVGAKKIILKAQQLFPELENVSQMLTVCEVHCSSEIKCAGTEMDWYGILQVEQTADEISIKKQYRKLALLLHPDKNKFPGAEAAFKLIGESSRVLSNAGSRSLYDMKRKAAFKQPSLPRQSQQSGRNYFRKQAGVQNSFVNPTAPQFSGFNQKQQQQMETFWTACPFCGIKYQYYRNIMNRALRCQHCEKPFIAHDIDIPGMPHGSNFGFSMNQSGFPQQKDIPSQGTGVAASSATGFQGNVRKEAATSTGIPMAAGGTSDGGFKAKTAGGVGEPNEAGRRGKSEAENLEEVNKKGPTVNQARNAGRKRSRKSTVVESSDESESSESNEEEEKMEEDVPVRPDAGVSSSYYRRRSSRNRQHVSYNEDGSDDDFVTSPGSKNKKSRVDGVSKEAKAGNSEMGSREDLKKTKEPSVETVSSHDEKDEKQKMGNPPKENIANGTEQARKVMEEVKSQADSKDDNSDMNSETEIKPEILEYPDPEFHDFDGDRAEDDFVVDQIWAVYDNLQGMPRYYARVRSVSSREFKLRITWLEPDPDTEEEIDWYNEELPVSCGIFKNGKTETTVDLPMFSHLVKWEKGVRRSSFKIYPRKGDVWAIFKDWNIKWSSDPDSHREYEYEIVEILTDYEDTGITVVYMVKLKGFTSLFKRMVSKGIEVSFQVSADELYRFSHQVPAYRMKGDERDNIPEGSLELDPASLPPKLDELLSESLESKVEEKTSKSATEKEKLATRSEKQRTPKKDIKIKENSTDGKEDQRNGDDSPIGKRFGKEKANNILDSEKTNLDGSPAKKSDPVLKSKVEEESVKDQGKNSASKSTTEREKPATRSEKQKTPKKGIEIKDNNDGDGIPFGKCFGKEKEKSILESGKTSDDSSKKTDQVKTTSKSPKSQPPSSDTAVYETLDPEFHDFSEDRSEEKFKPDQIWATYSEDDGMPRFYGRIKKVEHSGSKVHLTWLEPLPTSPKDIRWSKEKLPVVCGMFKPKASKAEALSGAEKFSHQIQLDPNLKNSKYGIYPKKGEVWAIFKNWNAEWKFSDLRNCEYEMVEILANMDDDNGLKVFPLVKVAGFSSVFKVERKRLGVAGIPKMIAKDELTRFSHQVPAFRLTEERGGKLRGCWELDPAAVPEFFRGNLNRNRER